MIEQLRVILGEHGVRSPAPQDAVHGAMPGAVVAPAGADDCAALLAECSANGWTVEIAGARTAADAGPPTASVDVLLSTERMNGIVEYEPDDLTIGVAGGTSLNELRARVGVNRQRVPLDPPSPNATVGGVLARAAAGPMRLSWATPRRQTLGIELVTGDGRVLRVGGRVVKNVAGYDLNKLVVGSAGTLGVITRAHLRLLPVPRATVDVAIEGAGRDASLEIARTLLTAAVPPAALELIGAPWRLLARYEGAQEAIDAALDLVGGLATEAGGTVARDPGALPALAVRERDAAVVVRVADLPDRLASTLDLAAGLAGPTGEVAAHAGVGIVRALLQAKRAATDADAATLGSAIEQARARCRGSVIVERGPARLMRVVDAWGPLPEPVLRLTRELKRQFDPAGILQRGRWIA